MSGVSTPEPLPIPPPGYLGDPSGISAYANKQTDIANSFALTLIGLANSFTAPVINPVFPSGPVAPPLLTAGAPTLTPIVWTSPSMPANFSGTLSTDDLMPAPFDEDPPVLSFATAPTFSEVAPSSPGVDLTYVDPGLTVNLPAAPSLLSLNVVPFSGMNLPTIDPDAIPTLTVVAPSIREYVPGAQYTSALLTDLKSYLDGIIVNGGTGLNADVENAIWDRGREREARSRANALLDLDKMEEMGFSLPPGVYFDGRLKIQTESDYVNRGTSREIMIKQAELALDSTKNSLNVATQLETKCMDYSNAVEQRLFEATKYATEAGIAIYNAQVQAYAAYLEAYKTKVQIYTAQIQAEVAKVDAYKATIEAETAKAQINTALVEQYKAQVAASLSAVEIYKARIDGIRIKAEIEKLKVDIFGEQVRAYGAKVSAYTAGVEGYRASIEAEGQKQLAFKTQVEAFAAQVQAGATQINARVETYKAQISAKELEFEGFKAAYQGEAAKAQATSAYNQSLSEQYRGTVAATTSYNEVLTKQWQVALDEALQATQIGVKAAEANGQLYLSSRSIAADAAKVGAQVSAQLGAAALNAINWSTHISNSTAYSQDYAEHVSYGTSDNTNTNYNYSV